MRIHTPRNATVIRGAALWLAADWLWPGAGSLVVPRWGALRPRAVLQHPLTQISEKYGLVYVVSKLGFVFVYDLESATAVYRNRISPDPVFLACPSDATGGIYCINRCVQRAVQYSPHCTSTWLGARHTANLVASRTETPLAKSAFCV